MIARRPPLSWNNLARQAVAANLQTQFDAEKSV